MAFRIITTFLILSIAITIGNGSILNTDSSPRNVLLDTINSILEFPKNSFLNFTELSGKYNYATETHSVTTDDGYILTVFRMRSKKCSEFKTTPVLLMHGLFQSADAWLDAGPDAGMAYLIANDCHDLWLGNQRGNYYGRKHVSLNPDKDPTFWNFTVDEMGTYDLPAIVDYILKNTEQNKLSYIGLAQAVGNCLIMCSERPGYCDKVNVLIALAPASRITNIKSLPLRTVFESVYKLEDVLNSLGIYEAFARGKPVQGLVSQLCKYQITSRIICGTGLGLLDSFNPGAITAKTLQSIATHTPAGTSIHTLSQYGQTLHSGKYQKFDYGEEENIKIYGTAQAPIYNLTAATVPVGVIIGNNDNVNYIDDVLWLVKQLPNVIEITKVTDPLWNHFDMIYSQYSKNLVYPKVSQYLLKYNTG